MEKLKSAIKQAYTQARVPAKTFASIVGKILSMSPAIGTVTRHRTRALYAAIKLVF